MKYVITKQYTRDEEMVLAEFSDLSDAHLFIDKKLYFNEIQRIKLIYRLYHQGKLLNEFNKENIKIPIFRAQYAQKDKDVLEEYFLQFRVIRNPDPIATFSQYDDAKVFIEAKLGLDAALKANITYNIYDNDSFLEEWNQNSADTIKKHNAASQGKVRSVSFRPTPFNTSPRPPGSPPPWIIDEEEDE